MLSSGVAAYHPELGYHPELNSRPAPSEKNRTAVGLEQRSARLTAIRRPKADEVVFRKALMKLAQTLFFQNRFSLLAHLKLFE